MRGIIFFSEEDKIIPLFFVLKKDKKYGENLVLNKAVLCKIDTLLNKMKGDIEARNYVEYKK